MKDFIDGMVIGCLMILAYHHGKGVGFDKGIDKTLKFVREKLEVE